MESNSRKILHYVFASYAALTFHRRSVTFVSQILRDSGLLTTQQLGVAASINATVFTITKFLSWTFVHRIGAKYLLNASLLLAAITAFVITFSHSFQLFLLIWALAGLAHGCSWPPCGFFIRNICSVDNFGAWWGIISSSSNFSALVGPILTSTFLSFFGFQWKFIFYINGLICIMLAFAVHKSLPDIMNFRDESSKASHETLSAVEYSWWTMLTNGSFMLSCFAYVLLSTIKFSFANWIHLCFIDSGISLTYTVQYVSLIEIGGLFGAFTSGFAADQLRKFVPSGKSKLAALILSSGSLLLAVYWLQVMLFNYQVSFIAIWANALLTGCFIASCYSLFGMIPMEIVGSKSAGRYSSVMDLAGSCGSLIAGYPISLLQALYGWSGVLVGLQIAIAFGVLTIFVAYIIPQSTISKDKTE